VVFKCLWWVVWVFGVLNTVGEFLGWCWGLWFVLFVILLIALCLLV